MLLHMIILMINIVIAIPLLITTIATVLSEGANPHLECPAPRGNSLYTIDRKQFIYTILNK